MDSEYLNNEYVLINLNNMGYEYNNEKQRDTYGKQERDKINKYDFDNENSAIINSGFSFQEYNLVEHFLNRYHYLIYGLFLVLFIFFVSYL